MYIYCIWWGRYILPCSLLVCHFCSLQSFPPKLLYISPIVARIVFNEMEWLYIIQWDICSWLHGLTVGCINDGYILLDLKRSNS